MLPSSLVKVVSVSEISWTLPVTFITVILSPLLILFIEITYIPEIMFGIKSLRLRNTVKIIINIKLTKIIFRIIGVMPK